MHYFIYPSKDTTLYKGQPNQNTGLDEVLEIQKAYYAGPSYRTTEEQPEVTITEISRVLIKFNIDEIAEAIDNGEITDPKFYLNLSVCQAEEIPFEYTIEARAISGSWEMGIGTKYDRVTTDGASWMYRDKAGGEYWDTVFTGSDFQGGTWHTGSNYQASQSFSYSTGDMRIDVTNIVNTWLIGSIENNGIILKHTKEAEDDDKDYGILKFFSMDTSTIYPPRLEVAWDDSNYETGSLEELIHEDMVVYMKNLRGEYTQDSKIKFRVVPRERIPPKIFSTGSQYVTVKYLPEETFYYSVRDAETKTVLIPFSEYTKISCDENGPYFVLWLNGLQPERFYEIVYKVTLGDTIQYFSNNFTFKLVR